MIRTALTLSAITKESVRIENIRAKRPNPGLQPQHLMACRAVRSICRGTLRGAEIGSPRLEFEPGPIVGGRYDFDIGTAGSVTLVAQTLIPILLQAPKESELSIVGGTHVMKSPGYDYFEHVFLPAARRFGAQVGCRMLRPGYYPRGGGEISLSVKPSTLHGCSAWEGDAQVKVLIRLSGLPESIAIREKKVFVQGGIEDIRVRQDESLSVGNAVTAWRGSRGAYVLGEKGKRAETVAQEALDAISLESGDVDVHLADQLLIYASIAQGPTRYSTSSLSNHFVTNSDVIGRFIGRRVSAAGNVVSVA